MSVVVAKKTKDGFIMGCDSVVIRGQIRGQATKVFKHKSNSDIIIGVVGSLRDLNIVSSMNNILDPSDVRREMVDTDAIISHVILELKEQLKKEGRLCASKEGGECMLSSIMIAYKDKCWNIGGDFSVSEIEDFDAIGAPDEFALGAYEIISEDEKITDKEKVIKVIKACIKRTIYVAYPILIAETTTDGIEEIKK